MSGRSVFWRGFDMRIECYVLMKSATSMLVIL